MVRILYPINLPFPSRMARSIQVVNTCHALARQGHRVTFYGAGREAGSWLEDGLRFYGLSTVPHLRIRLLRSWMARPGARIRLSWRGAFDVQVVWELLRARGRAEKTILYLRDLALAERLIIPSKLLGMKMVFEAHDLHHDALAHGADCKASSAKKIRRVMRQERRVFGSVSRVVVVSEGARQAIAEFLPGVKPTLIPNGVRSDFSGGPRPGGCPDGPVTYCGHLYGWKGPDVILRALSRVEGCRVLILGDDEGGKGRQMLNELTQSLGVADRVDLAGFVEPDQVWQHLVRARVLVLPVPDTHYNRRYTCPLKLLEYMSTGVPIVASDLPTVSAIARHGQEAWLVAPGNPEAMAQGIQTCLQDADLSRRLGVASLERVKAYSWDKRAERIIHVCEEMWEGEDRI